MKISGNEGGPFSILFRGCSTLLAYEAGVLAALKELSPNILKSASRVYGASSGSIVAAVGLCDCDIEEVKNSFFHYVKQSSWVGLLGGGNAMKILKKVLNKHLPTNAHQLVSGKLHIVVTRLHDWRSVTVSDFTSKQELIEAVLCSCFIPVFFGFLPPVYRGVRYIDGELGMWRANFISQTTITVSGFGGEYDICPRDCSAAFFTFQISDCILHISKRNIYRFMYIFLLPSNEVVDHFYTHGYQDTVSFLKRLGEFGINYLDEDRTLSLDRKSCQKDERTLHWKPETIELHSRATSREDVTQKNPDTIQAAGEEEAPQHLLHHQKGTATGEQFCPRCCHWPQITFKEGKRAACNAACRHAPRCTEEDAVAAMT
ncbi:omega-hydroxyceramide transacylase-like isoform X2 [Cuculus canorus]|uniref:omega-hydroxyceramide transacylase-like isoform X2 n=1 Tax=Cuculus canorus TaxID=55661 RepID=UPI0023AAB96F|nr:omega-hydroxyceramide transacylase-like isoform X2 [Cuculus canorus]